jgi:hypothetical protein
MKNLATAIGVLMIGSFLFFGTSFLMTYVSIDLIRLFQIPYLNALTFSNMFGLIAVVSLIRTKAPKRTDEDEAEKFARSIADTISGALTITFLWGLCYVAKYLFL